MTIGIFAHLRMEHTCLKDALAISYGRDVAIYDFLDKS